MIKGTIAIPDFYGSIKSIESKKDISLRDILVNKASGQRFQINAINLVTRGRYTQVTVVSIDRINGTYTRFIDFDILKQRFWKVEAQ